MKSICEVKNSDLIEDLDDVVGFFLKNEYGDMLFLNAEQCREAIRNFKNPNDHSYIM